MHVSTKQIQRTVKQSGKRSPEAEKLQTRLCRSVGEAIAGYRMTEEGNLPA